MIQKYRFEDGASVDHPIPLGWKVVDSKLFDNKTLYRQIVGQLIYVYVISRPDLGYVVNVLSRVFDCPTRDRWELAKRTDRYMKGTMAEGVVISGDKNKKYSVHKRCGEE